MGTRRSCLNSTILLVLGVALGWALAGGGQPARLLAGAGDHPAGSIIGAGALAMERHPALQTAITSDAVYYLNYSKGRLLAAAPFLRQTAGSSQVLSEFAERDLVGDFGLTPGRRDYHFAMVSGALGIQSDGWAPLYVFETTTGQMAAYRVLPPTVTGPSGPAQPEIRLLERRSDPRLALAAAARSAAPAR